MIEYVKKADALEIIKSPLPKDLTIEYIYDLKGVWLDEDEIDTSQTETADRPQGEWIFDPEILCSDIGIYSAGYRCSICGKEYFKVDGIRFCPNCGARMKGEDDD